MRTAHDHVLARLRFRHLQLITEIDRTGSLTAAAQALSLTQPALSKSLSELEGSFGFQLFRRTTRGLEKTAQGAVVMEGAARLLRELQHVHAEAQAVGGDGRAAGILRLGASAFLSVTLMPEVVRKLTRGEPPLLVRLREGSVPRLMASLHEGEVDALVTVYDSGLMAQPGSRLLRFETLSEERYVVLASSRHPLAKAASVNWKSLAGEPWVLTRTPSLSRLFLEDTFRRHGIEPPQPLCEIDSPVTAARMVAAGVGLGSVPESTAREAAAVHPVVVLKMRAPQPRATLGLVFRRSAEDHPHVRALRLALGLPR
jgi:DNA-binding transcriptional LysR family regulator